MEVMEPFFAALGVVLGGAVIGSLATLFSRGSPLATMLLLARNMKMWGVLVAIGGTMRTLKIIESGLLAASSVFHSGKWSLFWPASPEPMSPIG